MRWVDVVDGGVWHAPYYCRRCRFFQAQLSRWKHKGPGRYHLELLQNTIIASCQSFLLYEFVIAMLFKKPMTPWRCMVRRLKWAYKFLDNVHIKNILLNNFSGLLLSNALLKQIWGQLRTNNIQLLVPQFLALLESSQFLAQLLLYDWSTSLCEWWLLGQKLVSGGSQVF